MCLKKFLAIFFLITNFLFALQIGPPMFEQRIDGLGGYREELFKSITIGEKQNIMMVVKIAMRV